MSDKYWLLIIRPARGNPASPPPNAIAFLSEFKKNIPLVRLSEPRVWMSDKRINLNDVIANIQGLPHPVLWLFSDPKPLENGIFMAVLTSCYSSVNILEIKPGNR